VKRILTESGLAEYFDVIVLSKDIGYRKPDRRIFLHVAKLLELNPGQVVFVGDSFADDVLGPSAAGMIPVWKGVAVGVDSLDIPPVLARMLPI
jgi:HAD superfamily hydrolase (TIGR01509 family)